MSTIIGSPAVWYVAFYGSDRSFWIDYLSPAGFRHCSAFGYSPSAERWLCYDVTDCGTFVAALHPEAFDALVERLVDCSAKILRVERRDSSRYQHRVCLTCVSAVKHLIGSPSRAWRPYGLYRDLLASGAQPAFVDDTE